MDLEKPSRISGSPSELDLRNLHRTHTECDWSVYCLDFYFIEIEDPIDIGITSISGDSWVPVSQPTARTVQYIHYFHTNFGYVRLLCKYVIPSTSLLTNSTNSLFQSTSSELSL